MNRLRTGANLYLASNDGSKYLKNIQITTGTSTYRLDELSANSAATTSLITGFLYVTTNSQANDNSFSVIVVNGQQPLSRVGEKSTTVVLNTQTDDDFQPFDDPDKSTYVTDIEQLASTNLNFHYGVPGEDWNDETTNQFFEKPQIINKTRSFFNTIQPLQINLPYWYITANGPFNMNLDSRYMNQDVQTTVRVIKIGHPPKMTS
ncbi:unnamed protein product [Caenorhabditis sp. 36 PRJEB53466]|nr:unnamed protein product [Caenorhabditis sp. 36 PRJEB53466]